MIVRVLVLTVSIVCLTSGTVGLEPFNILVFFVRPFLNHVLQSLDVVWMSSSELGEVLAVEEAVLEAVNDIALSDVDDHIFYQRSDTCSYVGFRPVVA